MFPLLRGLAPEPCGGRKLFGCLLRRIPVLALALGFALAIGALGLALSTPDLALSRAPFACAV